MASRILLVDDEASILGVLKTLLKVEGYEVTAIQEGQKAAEIIKSEEYDLMISDIRMTPVSGMDLLRLAYDIRPSMAVIMVTAFGSVETAVEAVRMGAYDYITKPFKIDELLVTVERALEYRRAMAENVTLKSQLDTLEKFENIVAQSAAMRNVCEMIEHVGPTDTTVLIRGELGTGKQLIARALHGRSRRKDQAFVVVDCNCEDAEDLEMKLFGYGRGASPDHPGGATGAFEEANGGSIYLGQVGALPPPTQEKLLRTLQEKTVRKLGGSESVPVDVRVLAGGEPDLPERIREGRFREDLYQRLGVIPIELPPLRSRQEDILPLVADILHREVGEGQELPSLDPHARDILMRYQWPGNVGELEDALRTAFAKCKGNKIAKDDIPGQIVAAVAGGGKAVAVSEADKQRGRSLKAFLRAKEKDYVQQVLKHTGGDKNKAAKALDISLATLYRKLPTKEDPQAPPPQ